MKKFVFVILHYFTLDDTKLCVKSILENANENKVEIVIVDNGSTNNSGEELKEIYKNNKNIHVIINKTNLGFAKGNNVGFIYAKNNLNPDFIIMCNNDTYLLDELFFKQIEEEYKKSKFAVLGPMILLPNNQKNPITMKLPDIKLAKRQLLDARLNYYTNLFYIYKLYKFIRNSLKKVLVKAKIKKEIESIDDNKRYENIVLHGSFLIFSKQYFSKYDGLDDRTFLYGEEELLAFRLKKDGLKSVYNPDIKIFHNEDRATNAVLKNNRKKQLFVWKYQIESTKILLESLKETIK